MAVGGWHGPHGFNVGWCENFEFKKLMNDDLGVATGEQGTVLRYVRQSKLADKVLAPLAPQLSQERYVGYVDVNCIVDHNGTPWPLEFTMRPGWPTFNIQQPLHEGDPVQWLLDLYNGRDAGIFTLNKICQGVVLSIPDYPYSHLTRKEVVGVPIYGGVDDAHLCECKMGTAPHKVGDGIVDIPCVVTAGDYVLVMTGSGDTVSAASKEVYKCLKAIHLPNSPMYRTDIGRRLKKQLPLLRSKGFARGMEY